MLTDEQQQQDSNSLDIANSTLHDSQDDICEALRRSNDKGSGGGNGARSVSGSGSSAGAGVGHGLAGEPAGGYHALGDGDSVSDRGVSEAADSWYFEPRHVASYGGGGENQAGAKCDSYPDNYHNSYNYNNAVAAAATAAMLDYCSNLGADPSQSMYGHHHHNHPHQNPANNAVSSLLNMNMNMNMNMNVSMNTAAVSAAAAAATEAAAAGRQQTPVGHGSGSPVGGGSNSASSGAGSAFVFSSPPLAALHNLTEMKFPSSSSFLSQQDYQQTMKQMQMAMAAGSTPHGINDILSRPHALLPRLGSSMYLGSPQIRFPKLAELPGRQPIYWPGVMTQPWRPPPGKPSPRGLYSMLAVGSLLCSLLVYVVDHLFFWCVFSWPIPYTGNNVRVQFALFYHAHDLAVGCSPVCDLGLC